MWDFAWKMAVRCEMLEENQWDVRCQYPLVTSPQGNGHVSHWGLKFVSQRKWRIQNELFMRLPTTSIKSNETKFAKNVPYAIGNPQTHQIQQNNKY